MQSLEIFLPFIFSVKSILANSIVSKTEMLTIYAQTKLTKTVKIADFETPDSQKLISPKI